GAPPPMRMTASWSGSKRTCRIQILCSGRPNSGKSTSPTTEPRERSMRQATTLPAPQRTCSRGDCATLFVSLDSSLENHRPEESNNVKASGGKQVDDLLDGFVGAVVGGFEFAGRLVSDVGAVMETAVGKRAAEPLVEEQEEQRHLDPFRCEAIGVAGA